MRTLTAVLFLAVSAVSAGVVEAKRELKTEREKIFYALGLAAGENRFPVKLDSAKMRAVEKGLRDAALGRPRTPPKAADVQAYYEAGVDMGNRVAGFLLKESELKFVEMGVRDRALGRPPLVDFKAYDQKVVALHKERVGAAAKPFLDQSAKEPGAVVTPTGLIYKELKAGNGASPKAADKVKVHYQGTFANGTVFDSSLQRGQPAEFVLNQVIACWTEGLQKMKVGGKAKLVCPAGIAYGELGRPGAIPPGATLVFEVELLDIVK